MLFLLLALYQLLLPIFFVLSFPGWLLKMAKRGGIGTGLLERFSIFKRDSEFERQGVIYIHAVSVGEVLIAVKLIKKWLIVRPEERVLLVPTTATGHAVAKQHAPAGTRVIYSPLDVGFILRRVFKRFQPKQIILMESEIWPNMLNVARKMEIPVSIANARLSSRSEKRYRKLSCILKPLLAMISKLCAQDEGDRQRWIKAGVDPHKIVVTGSIKFDQSGATKPELKPEFQQMLDTFKKRPVVMAVSTHIGEEAWIAEALKSIKSDVLVAFVPRHAERRSEVKAELEQLGYSVKLRSEWSAGDADCFVIDSTGELGSWTNHAHVAIVGKSILSRGGQNPTEAIAAKVPVIVGTCMRNFEPLVSHLKSVQGIESISSQEDLLREVTDLLSNDERRESQTEAAVTVLRSHQGATARTVDELS